MSVVLNLTNQKIAQTVAGFKYSNDVDAFHEHYDCVRIAYQWFDAQNTRSNSTRHHHFRKELIKEWAGRYVSNADLEVAAFLHPRMAGAYPSFNLSKRLINPCKSRLGGIGEAFTQNYFRPQSCDAYFAKERRS